MLLPSWDIRRVYVRAKKNKRNFSLTVRHTRNIVYWFDNSETNLEFLPCVFFHLRRKGFLHKYLYFCVWLLFWIDNIDGNIIWDVIVVSKLGWFSGWLFVWIKMKEKGLLWLRWSYPKTPFGWSENRKDRKGRVENKEENDVFPCLVQERKHKGWKILGKKIHPGPQIFILLIWEEKWEEKREKWG